MEHYPSPRMMASISVERKARHIATSSRIVGTRLGRSVKIVTPAVSSDAATAGAASGNTRACGALSHLEPGDVAHLARASFALGPVALARGASLDLGVFPAARQFLKRRIQMPEGGVLVGEDVCSFRRGDSRRGRGSTARCRVAWGPPWRSSFKRHA